MARDLYCDPYAGNNYRPKAKHSARVKRRLKRAVKSTLDVNRWYYRDAGGEDRPAFYDIDKTYPSLRELDQNYAVIREEIDSVLLQETSFPVTTT